MISGRSRRFAGQGEMADRMRAFDWESSPLGPPDGWPVALRTTVDILLTSQHPLFIFWGREHRCFYNDAYARSIGPEKHAVMLGAKGCDLWPETWHIIGPQIDHVMSGRGSTWHENQLIPLIRHGRREDAYWTYGYSPIPDADSGFGIGGVLVICTETTQHVENKERLGLLADAMPQLVWIGRSDGMLEYVNRRLCDYTGLSAAEVMNRDAWRSIIHPDDWDASDAAWSQAMARAEPYMLEHRLRGADGSYRWFLVRAQPERDAYGRIVRWYGTSTDIHESKQLQRHLEATEAALRDVDMRKDVFLATLSHELRNPLAPIRNAAQILSTPAVDPARLQWAQSVIQRQVKHMAWLLDDLLDVARITQGKLELRKESTSLERIVEAAVESARPQIDDKGHELVVRLPPVAPVMEVDPLRLAQVVANLLTNAAKYTDPGGHIELTGDIENRDVLLIVRDDGIGIPQEAIARIFDMFSQADNGSSRSDGGLGIGLALVKGLIELHGGSIEVRSAGLGQGSEFLVRLPLTASVPQAMTASAAAPSVCASRGRRVLIADDNRDAADSLAMLVELAGHDVRVAHDGRGALALAQVFRPDVALLDIGMPDLTGYEVAAALRGEAWGAEIHLVALTGWGQERDRERSAAAGFNRHLTKPIDLDALGEVLAGSSV